MALIHANFFSTALGMCVNCEVILPQRVGAHIGAVPECWPTLWLLHGASDDETAWVRRTSIERYVAPLGLAVVMPAVRLSNYANMAHGQRFYDYVSRELPTLMRDFFPLSDKREDNFIAGLSMGGAGCLKIGLANPQNYAAIGCLSAGAINRMTGERAKDPARIMRNKMVYGERELAGTEEDVFESARRIVRQGLPAPRIYHACGAQDFLLDSAHETRDFFYGFEGNPFDYHYDEDPGIHSWAFWDEHIQSFLKYLNLPPVEGVRG